MSSARLGDGGASALAFTPDGALLLSGDGRELSVWRGTSLARLGEVAGHNIHVIAVSPDGTRAAVGGDEAAVRVCDLATLDARGALVLEHGANALAWSADGKSVFVLDRRGHVLRWTVDGACETLATSPLDAMALGASARTIAGVHDLDLVVIDVATLRARTVASGLSLGLCAVALSRDGALAAAGSLEGEVAVYDVATGAQRWKSGVAGEPIESLAFDASARRLAAGADADDSPSRNTVAVWDVASGAEVERFRPHESWFNALAISPDGTRLATCSGTQIAVRDLPPR